MIQTMERPEKNIHLLGGLTILLAAGVFALDHSAPLGVAAGLLYLLVVSAASWLPRRRYVLCSALVSTVLLFFGLNLTPPGGGKWSHLSNQFLIVYTIWINTIVSLLHKQVAAALRRSETRYRQVVELCPDALLIACEGKLVLANSTAARLLRARHPDQLVGKSLMEIVHPEYRAKLWERLEELNLARDPPAIENKITRCDGTMVDAEIAVTTVAFDGRPAVQAVVRDITARKEAAEALRQAEEKYRSLFENAIEGIFRTTPEGRYLMANPALAQMLGYETPAELIANVTDIARQLCVDPGARERLKQLLAEHGIVRGFESQLYRKDGSRIWVSISAREIRDAGGQLLYYEGTNEDITERKQAREALREAEARLRTIFESEPECVKLLAADGTLLDMNPAGLAMIEADSLEEVRGKVVYPLVAPGYRAGFRQLSEAVFQGRPGRLEFELVGLRGARRWLETHAVPYRNERGEIVALLAITRDITEQKKALELNQTILRTASDGFWMLDMTGRILDVNEAYCRVVGFAREELLGMSLPDVEASESPERIAEHIRKIKETGFDRFETRHRRKDGWLIDLDVSVRHLEFEGGRLVAFFRDLTARKRLESRDSAFANLGQRLSAARTPPEAAEIIAELADRLFGWDSACLHLCSPGRDRIYPVLDRDRVAGRRTDVASPNVDFEPSPMDRRVIAEGAQLVLREAPVRFEPGFLPFGDKARPSASLMYVPIRHGSKVIGTMSIQSYTEKAYNREDLITLQCLADYCGGAMERIRVEEALRESEERYRVLVEHSPDAIMVHSGEKFLYASPAAVRLFGARSPSELVGRDVLDLVHPDFRSLVVARSKQVQELGARTAAKEIKIVRIDGEPVSVEAIDTPVPYQGRPAVQVMLRDITERKQAEKQIRLLADALASSTEMISITDMQDRFTYVNSAFLRTYGYTEAEIPGKTPEILYSPRNPPRLLSEVLEQTRRGGWKGEILDRRKDGTEFPIFLSTSVIRNAQGEAIGLVGVARDISERKRLEAQLLQAQKMETVGRLAGGIAHDFNNLLQVILGASDLLRDRFRRDQVAAGELLQIRKAGERATALVRQLLAFSRKQFLQPKELDLNALVADTSKLLRPLIGEDIELALVLREDPGRVKADPVQLEQVIMNLAINARDAMPHGGKLTLETAKVQLDAAYVQPHAGVEAGDYVALIVSDTGCGMSAEVKSHLFEPFFTTKEVGKGTGLGLSTVYGIVKQSGGHIEVDSELGKGAVFKIFLPATGDPQKTSPPAAPALPGLPGRSETILLVEDADSVRTLLSRLLHKHGYEVLQAGNGSEALQLAGDPTRPIDLLITDVVMPLMNGRELSERLRVLCPELKVLFISGHPVEILEPEGNIPRRAVFLQKPFTIDVLLRKVRELLDGPKKNQRGDASDAQDEI